MRSTIRFGWERFKEKGFDRFDSFSIRLPFCEKIMHISPYTRAYYACLEKAGENKTIPVNGRQMKTYIRHAQKRINRWLGIGEFARAGILLEEACYIAKHCNDKELLARWKEIQRGILYNRYGRNNLPSLLLNEKKKEFVGNETFGEKASFATEN
ncbi:MAG: hypothetical protein V1822_02630 [Candidatus Micrarchaeota archaeon]